MILRCTKKLLAVLDAGRVADPVPQAEDWYANLLWFDRRKCLLLTHAATLFSVFEADVRAAALRDTHSLVTGLIERELQREDLPPGTFGNLRGQGLVVAKTADRSVLGCMNDMAFLSEVAITDAGGLAQCDLRRKVRAPRPKAPVTLVAPGPLVAHGPVWGRHSVTCRQAAGSTPQPPSGSAAMSMRDWSLRAAPPRRPGPRL